MEEQKTQTSTAIEKTAAGPRDLKAWIKGDEFKAALAQSLPSHMTPDRYARICLTALMRTPKLAQCTKESLFKAMLDCSSLGLEPDGRRAHLIPYDKKELRNGQWVVARTEAQLIIDYKGLVELAKRSGEVVTIRAELVCENDEFSWENGVVTHRIDWRKPRGKTQCVYSHVRNKSGVDEYEVMTLDEVNAIRNRSKAKDNGPWVTDFNEMAKKTLIRRHSKKLTLSPEFNDALERDDDRLEEVGPTFTLDDIMPQSQSEVDAAAESKSIQAEATQVVTAPDPEAPLTSDNLAKILQALKDQKVTNEKLNVYLNSVIGVRSIDRLKDIDVERVCAWIRNQSTTK